MYRIGIISLALTLGSSLFLQAGTTLSKAAIKGDVSKIQACIASGEKVDEIDKWGWTPLMWAVYYKYVPATQCLLENKANPNIQSTLVYGSIPKNSTPLIICAYYGTDEHARLLLKAGADPNITNESGKKALDYAQEYGFQEVVDLLTKKNEAPKHQAAPKPQSIQAPPAPQPQPASQTQPVPQAQPTSQARPVQEDPAPSKKRATVKKAAPVKKQDAPQKSEPPAIK